jgi:hypothetical protein
MIALALALLAQPQDLPAPIPSNEDEKILPVMVPNNALDQTVPTGDQPYRWAGQVEVNGAGYFVADDIVPVSNLPINLAPSEVPVSRIYRVGFNPAGSVTSCVSGTSLPLDADGEYLCAHIKNNAKFEFFTGYELPSKEGFTTIEAKVVADVAFANPVEFNPKNSGFAVKFLYYAPSSPVNKGACIFVKPDINKAAKKQICDAFDLTEQAKDPKHKDLAINSPVEIEVKRATTASIKHGINYSLLPVSDKNWPVYAAFDVSDELILKPEDGSFYAAIYDYPATALQNEWGGRSRTAIGIAPDGKVVSCRPVETSGTSVLDNEACKMLLRRGRFMFSAAALKKDGVRYLFKNVVWRIPLD